jgi:hypothetical protein
MAIVTPSHLLVQGAVDFHGFLQKSVHPGRFCAKTTSRWQRTTTPGVPPEQSGIVQSLKMRRALL